MTILRALAAGSAPPRHGGSSQRERGRDHGRTERGRPGPSGLIVKKEVGVVRLAVLAVLTCGLVWIGWDIVGDAAAHRFAISAPEDALRWSGSQPEALNQLALNALRDPSGDIEAARRWAQRALRADPLNDQALLELGLVAERSKDKQRADLLARMAGARTWRNPATQLWLFEREVRRRNYDRALQHADAVLRANPTNGRYKQLLFRAFTAFLAYPPSFQALAKILASPPPWRQEYWWQLAHDAADPSRMDRLYAHLKKSENPPTEQEEREYVDHLVRIGHFAQAHRVWHDTLPAAQRAEKSYLYNGDFTRPVGGGPFNWVLRSLRGADIGIVSLDGSKQRALQIEFSGARVGFANVSQLLLLPPGRYRLEGKVKAEDLRTPRGLWWHVFCAEASDPSGASARSLGHGELVSGSLPWTRFDLDFEVPPEGCPAQWLRLELPARVASERRIEGQIWYQDLRINPIPEKSGPNG